MKHALIISDFAQGNSTSHPPHSNINKNSWWNKHNQHACPNRENRRPQKSNAHKVLNGNNDQHFVIFQTCNDLLISETILNKKSMCKHVNYCVQMLPQPIVHFVLHESKSGESVFVFHKSKTWNNGYFNQLHIFT